LYQSYTKMQLLSKQGDGVPKDAQDYKDELKRVLDYVTDLHKRVMKECDNFSEDVKYWAEYKTGIKEFRPWLESAEKKSQEGLSKPQDLDEALAMLANVTEFNQSCLKHLKLLNDAATAANKMTTHKVITITIYCFIRLHIQSVNPFRRQIQK